MTEAQLRAFLAVADHGSFREAALRLHLSQPGVSRAVKALETELGVELLTRGPTSVKLTPIGAQLAARSRTIITEAAAMRQDANRSRGVISGHIRLGSMPSVSAALLPDLLTRLEARHPALNVAVLEGHDDELVEWARAGTVDLAVVAGHHPGLTTTMLATDDFLAVLPAGHPLATADVVSTTDLAELPFIITRAGCERLVLAALGSAGVTPDVHHEVTEASTILAMVAEGLGVSIMPGLATRNAPTTVALRPLDPPARRQLAFAHSTDRSPTPATRAFLEIAAPGTREPPPGPG